MSVVTINSRLPEIKEIKSKMVSGIGTGVVWDFDGHIVTNHHVILPTKFRHATSILLKHVHLEVHLLNSEGVEKPYIAKIVGMDFGIDLAVLKISIPKSDLKPIMVEDSTNIEIGQECFLIGATQSYRHSLVTGRISGLNRDCHINGRPPSNGLIQIDASTNPGISGAPVLDYNGHMIAIHRAGLAGLRQYA
ncbi:hypothetical protein KSP39_PZI020980 [Platanthera zijinensis]|uniref:Uncharacterized protein n=1 Tax=Platanthera zijinensis TaxID=2320716 RepID=A0AAP0FVV0_9ASPA